jgi:hypothetical protein
MEITLLKILGVWIYVSAFAGTILILLNLKTFTASFIAGYRQEKLGAIKEYPEQIRYVKSLIAKKAIWWDRLSRFYAAIGFAKQAHKYANQVDQAFDTIKMFNDHLIDYYNQMDAWLNSVIKGLQTGDTEPQPKPEIEPPALNFLIIKPSETIL